MPILTIPTIATTQTVTGDNGVTTAVSYMTNDLTAPYWGRTGVGLAGSNYDPAGEAALIVDFSNAVEDVSFVLFDVDQAVGSWDDQVRVEAFDLAGNPIPVTYTTTGTGHIAESDGSNGNLQIEASNNAGDNQSTITINIAGPVGSFRVYYEDGNDLTNDAGVINIESLSFTNAFVGDGTVTGTSGNDVIDGSYAGDLEGDFVDNNDAILAGDTGNDDLIYGLGGNDSILAGGGADEVYGGSGDDTIDGGAGDDLLVGDQTTDTNGNDTITGGAGNDTIYGDTAGDTNAVAGTTVFSWNTIPREDGLSVTGGVSGTTTNGDVRVALSVEQEANFTSATIEKTDLLFDYNGVSDTSSISLTGGSSGTSADAVTIALDFSAAEPGFADEVTNVTFGIFDLDQFDSQFRDQIIVRAYDIDGNLIPVTLTAGAGAPITIGTDANGNATATANATAGNTAPDTSAGFVQVSVAGPVARIEVDYNNIDPTFGAHAIRLGDITLDSIALDDASGGGNDSLEGGLGDDVIYGQTGSDTIGLSNTFGNDTIFGGEDAGDTDTDVLDGSALTEDVTVVMSAPETGTISNLGGDLTSFSEIEEIRTGSGDDSVTGSTGDDVVDLGQGTDTINAGEGDDTINLGEDSPGTPDGDADVVILEDNFGNDVISNFDAPTSNGDGTFTGIDTFDVSNLNDLDNAPVNTNDVTVTDDGSGNAVLTFPNGESVTLIGIDPAAADDPFYLNAMGIPMPPPDGIVTGTQGADVIDAAYAGDIEGDMVDAGDALVTGQAPNDDIIVAQGGDDSISAGAGDDLIYGGDGADSIDAGAGDDTVYGDTAEGVWFYEYYDLDPTSDAGNLAQSGFANGTADFEGIPTGVGYTDSLDPNLIDTENDFALKFSSVIEITTAGDYIFETTSNDGSKLFIDGVEVVNNDGQHLPTSVAGTPINLSAGTHLIEIIFFENEGTSFLTSSVSGPDTGNVAVDLASYDGLRAATGNDTIAAGAGNDTLFGGGGDDVFVVDESDDTDTITGGEDAGGTDTDTVSFASVTTTDGVSVSFTGDEAADYLVGTIGSDGTFTEIERVVGTDNADTIDLSSDSLGIAVESGAGDDVVTSGQGDDIIATGTGQDDIVINNGFGNDTIDGGSGLDGTGDVIDGSALTQAVTVNISASETGTINNGADELSFAEIEAIITGSGSDTVFGSDGGDVVSTGAGNDTVTGGVGDDTFDLGSGADTINAGGGDDTVDLGTNALGNPDGNPDQVVLTDNFGNDIIDNFDAPSPNGDGTFTGIDRFDVSGLNDLNNNPVNTNDVTVTDDGAGNAVLTFPNGESVTLIGISPLDADDPFYLNAIGIPIPDGIVTGTQDADVIDASYTGDPDSDLVDAGDALLAGEGANDDIIVAQGGDDSITAGDGADDIYGGDGSDTINAGAGDDIVYGDTPDGAWFYEYYDLDPTGNPQSLADAGFISGTTDFDGIPTSIGYTDSLDPALIDNADNYALKFSTVLQVTTAGDYTFSVASDDGSRMFIDGVEVVVNDFNHPLTTVTGAPINLSAGDHVIEIIYYDNGGFNQLGATISGPDTGDVATDLAAYDGLRAASGDDLITGGTGDDTLFGGTGDDQFNIAESDDTDTITGGEDTDGLDIDTVSFATVGTADGVSVSFTGDEAADYLVGTTGSDGTFTDIERVVGTTNADSVDLTADSAGVTVETGAGDDVVTGGQGADSINTGTGQDNIIINDDFGNDAIDGGTGSDGTGDVLDGSGLTQGVTVDFSAAETGTVDNGTDVLNFAEIEEIFTGSGDDTVFGGAGSDTVSTGSGVDEVTFGYGDDIDTGAGDDTLILANQGPDTNGGIFIDGGDEERDVNGVLIGEGDVLDLGDLADLSTLSTTTDPDGSLSGTVELDDGTLLTFTDIERIICFTPGTTIATPHGARAIETLKVGDLVMTRDHGLQPIRWIQSRTVAATGKFAPVRIRPGAVVGLETDLLVSPQHRMLFTGYRAELLFGEREVLMPALHLVDNKLVTRETGGEITYIHMMFDSHEVIYADGAASESFHPGEDSLNGITGPAREELFALFPELRSNPTGYGPAARRCLKKHETHMLQVN